MRDWFDFSARHFQHVINLSRKIKFISIRKVQFLFYLKFTISINQCINLQQQHKFIFKHIFTSFMIDIPCSHHIFCQQQFGCHLSSHGNLFDQYRNLKTNSVVSHQCASRKMLREFYYFQHNTYDMEFRFDSQFNLNVLHIHWDTLVASWEVLYNNICWFWGGVYWKKKKGNFDVSLKQYWNDFLYAKHASIKMFELWNL